MSLVISRARLLDPASNTLFAVPAIAISLFVFAYSTIYGQKAILVFYALWFPLLLLAPERLIVNRGPILFVLLVPAFATLSVLWSDTPATTLRASIQYGTTVLCGLIAARVVSVRSLTTGGMIGGFVILLYSHNDGTFAYDYLDASYALQGAFNSKNQLGSFAALTAFLAVAFTVRSGTPLVLRALAGAVAVFAVWTLIRSDSATSAIAILAGLFTALVVLGMMRIGIGARAQSIVIVLCIAMGLAALAAFVGALDTVFAVFGKDSTLTGRTFLWSMGLLFGEERPLLGLGYYAFWVHNRPEAEDLWLVFYITARTGFHFHNTLVESFVALGLVGTALVGSWMVALVVSVFRVSMNTGRRAEAAICAGLAVNFFIRAGVEIDFFTPYTLGSFLVPYLIVQMSDARHATLARHMRAVPS